MSVTTRRSPATRHAARAHCCSARLGIRNPILQFEAPIREQKPDIAHCHNIHPLVSPSAYYACRAKGVPVVQTLHNYRLICPAGTLFRSGQPCDGCGRQSILGIWRGCYRDSKAQTATVAAMTGLHRLAGTWTQVIDAYVAPSQFCREMHVHGGLPAERIVHRPNFLAADPGQRTGRGEYALFVGRLCAEKGVLEMLDGPGATCPKYPCVW